MNEWPGIALVVVAGVALVYGAIMVLDYQVGLTYHLASIHSRCKYSFWKGAEECDQKRCQVHLSMPQGSKRPHLTEAEKVEFKGLLQQAADQATAESKGG